jgi:ABC-type lipoprotein export system ATPase subunit
MTLSVVVGASGSGKTTFLEGVHKLHKCCYVRQYHTVRPYIQVRKIPNFESSRLPYWDLYVKKTLEGGAKNASYNPAIKIGGTMAGKFTAGLSGGQRKMMLFELVRQRTESSNDLLIVLDEPFAGVTDDFVPYITSVLEEMRTKHNILLVTNDHVGTLTELADSTITVSAIDRAKVLLNGVSYEREVALHAVAVGNEYQHHAGSQDLLFFANTELFTNPQVGSTIAFTIVAMLFFLLSYWDSKPGSEALLLVALNLICYFALKPYLVALADWRNTMKEEAEALMSRRSVQMNLALKSCIVLLLLTFISIFAFGCLQSCIGTLGGVEVWVMMLFDSASLTFPFICFGLYSSLPLQTVTILSSLSWLFVIFFSTTFSPGSGVEGVKALRYLFARFYFWCRVPGYKEMMEGCPADDTLVWYTILTGCLPLILFVVFQFVRVTILNMRKQRKDNKARAEISMKPEYKDVQNELYKNHKNQLVPGTAEAISAA